MLTEDLCVGAGGLCNNKPVLLSQHTRVQQLFGVPVRGALKVLMNLGNPSKTSSVLPTNGYHERGCLRCDMYGHRA